MCQRNGISLEWWLWSWIVRDTWDQRKIIQNRRTAALGKSRGVHKGIRTHKIFSRSDLLWFQCLILSKCFQFLLFLLHFLTHTHTPLIETACHYTFLLSMLSLFCLLYWKSTFWTRGCPFFSLFLSSWKVTLKLAAIWTVDKRNRFRQYMNIWFSTQGYGLQ